jgi:hypothetical protein
MAHGVENKARNLGPLDGERVAGAGVIDEVAIGRVPVVEGVVEAAQRYRRTEGVALAGVIEHGIEDHGDAGPCKGDGSSPRRGRAGDAGSGAMKTSGLYPHALARPRDGRWRSSTRRRWHQLHGWTPSVTR